MNLFKLQASTSSGARAFPAQTGAGSSRAVPGSELHTSTSDGANVDPIQIDDETSGLEPDYIDSNANSILSGYSTGDSALMSDDNMFYRYV